MSNKNSTPDETKKVLFGEIIQQTLKSRKISQAALAEMLGVSRNTVNNWVADKYKPEHEVIVKLCEVLSLSLNDLYGVQTSEELSSSERTIINNYRMLNDTNKRTASKILYDMLDEQLLAQDRYLKESFMLLECPHTKAAAGQGSDFLEIPSSHVFIRKNGINAKADAIIEVTGESMLPVYNDGDFVYIEYADTAYPGQDVVCTTANGGVIKRLTADYKLESVNPDFPFGEKSESDNIRIIGRVLGVVDPHDRPTDKELLSLNELFADDLRELSKAEEW